MKLDQRDAKILGLMNQKIDIEDNNLGTPKTT